jgi:3-oxoacyl-[acyl-carrier protein] reductase
MNKLSNKVAVVTGASKGIGAAIAKQMAAAGASVVVNYATSREGADRVVREIIAAGGDAVSIQANVAHEDEVDALFRGVKEKYRRVDILVNNAGVYSFAPLESITVDLYRSIYDTNVLGLLLASKAALPLFPESGGAIVNISSVVSAIAPATASIYASSKAAVVAITKSLAKELGPRKIRVNALNPGVIRTEGLASAGITDSDLEVQLVSMAPLARVGLPDDVALPAVFLASDEARYITGETLFVSGGAGM